MAGSTRGQRPCHTVAGARFVFLYLWSTRARTTFAVRVKQEGVMWTSQTIFQPFLRVAVNGYPLRRRTQRN
jgi:hypothetical protein